MDAANAVGYYCIKHNADGSCVDGLAVLVILSRYLEIPEEDMTPLKQYLTDTCMKNRKLKKVDQSEFNFYKYTMFICLYLFDT